MVIGGGGVVLFTLSDSVVERARNRRLFVVLREEDPIVERATAVLSEFIPSIVYYECFLLVLLLWLFLRRRRCYPTANRPPEACEAEDLLCVLCLWAMMLCNFACFQAGEEE